MKQRGFGLIAYAIAAGVLAVMAGTLLWKWSSFKEDLREDGRAEIRVLWKQEVDKLTAAWEAERQSLIVARDAMILRWSVAIQNVERVYVDRIVVREVAFSGLRQRVGTIKPPADSCALRIDAAVAAIMRDASTLANDRKDSAAAGEDQRAAAPVSGPAGVDQATAVDQIELTAKWIEAAEAYSSAREKWAACVLGFEAVQKASETP